MHDKNSYEPLNIMNYTLNSGVKGTVELTMKQMQEWIECNKTEKYFVTEVGKFFLD